VGNIFCRLTYSTCEWEYMTIHKASTFSDTSFFERRNKCQKIGHDVLLMPHMNIPSHTDCMVYVLPPASQPIEFGGAAMVP